MGSGDQRSASHSPSPRHQRTPPPIQQTKKNSLLIPWGLRKRYTLQIFFSTLAIRVPLLNILHAYTAFSQKIVRNTMHEWYDQAGG